MMFFLLIAIGFIVYYFVFDGNKANLPNLSKNSPEDIIRERFAKGEIDELTYTQMIETLKN